jgi:DNA-binding response OmpR family regulator
MERSQAATSQKSILLIEDDPAIASALGDVLEASNYRVVRVESGAEARAALERESIDLVVLDLMLPDVDGLVLLSSLKGANVPIIICSALDRPRERILGLKLGADDFIAKPVDIYEFEARIEALLRRRANRPKTVPQQVPGVQMGIGNLPPPRARRRRAHTDRAA